jgi:hypothetical protein
VSVRTVSSSRVDNALRIWPPRVAAAALVFEERWTRATLRRVDGGLSQRFDRQVELYRAAIEGGTAEQIEVHGAAMVRGYAACAAALAELGIDDDAYVIGACPAIGARPALTIAIGNQRAAVVRVRERFGADVAFFTADELATLLAGLPGAVAAADVKRVWPGAEVVEAQNIDAARPGAEVVEAQNTDAATFDIDHVEVDE